jgi:hypothetical protein
LYESKSIADAYRDNKIYPSHLAAERNQFKVIGDAIRKHNTNAECILGASSFLA